MNWEFFRGQEADPYRLGTEEELQAERYTHDPGNVPFGLRQWLWNVKDRKTEEDFHVRQVHAPRHSIHR